MRYVESVENVRPEHLCGFFAGWPSPPTRERHLELLRGSAYVVLAVEDSGDVAGFVTAISDGVLAAYIPLLEVRADRQGQGIGSDLARRMFCRLARFYMVDVVCDADVLPFYERLGLRPHSAAILRNRLAIG